MFRQASLALCRRQCQTSLSDAEAESDALAHPLIVLLALEAEGGTADTETERSRLADVGGGDVRPHHTGQRLAAFQRNSYRDLLPRDAPVPWLGRESAVLGHTVGQQSGVVGEAFVPRRSWQHSVAWPQYGLQIGGTARSRVEQDAAGAIRANLHVGATENVHGQAFG